MDEPNADQFADMAQELYQQPDIEHTLERIVQYAQEATACDEGGIMLLHGRNKVETAYVSDPKVAAADKLQMELNEGPCLRAMWDHDVFIIKDLATDSRWPAWGPKAAALGMSSMLAIRLFTPRRTVGALNLYAIQAGAFDDDDLDVADIFGRHASIALASAHEGEGLRDAIGARHMIGQAQGILMERYGLDSERSFMLLRRYSQHHNLKLRDVARMVVTNRQLPGPPAS